MKRKSFKGENNPSFKHGYTGNHKLYTVWRNMKGRCFYNKNPHYKNYGGRGITMCPDWITDFMNFFNWAIENGYKEGLTIDRKDNDGNYGPDNCRFVNRVIQGRNQRTRRNSKSGFKGVNPTRRVNSIKWRSRITVNKETIWLGVYDTPEQAHQSRVDYVSENDLKNFIL